MPRSTPTRSQGEEPPAFGLGRPRFGLSKETSHRVELLFALKSGASLTVFHYLADELSEVTLNAFVEQLEDKVGTGHGRLTFVDSWGSTGLRAWVDIENVAAFSVRPVR